MFLELKPWFYVIVIKQAANASGLDKQGGCMYDRAVVIYKYTKKVGNKTRKEGISPS